MIKSKMTRRSLAAGALVAGVLGGSMQAGAAPIEVKNAGFELPDPANPGPHAADWNGGFADFTAGWGSNTFSLAHNYGVDSGTQQTAYTVLAAGEVYTLTVQVPLSLVAGSQIKIDEYTGELNLTLDSTTAASNAMPPTEFATYALLTTTYTTTSGDVGKTVGILLGGPSYVAMYNTPGNGGRVYFDNVALDVVAVPEPASLALVTGLAGSLLLTRRRRDPRPE